MTRPRRAFPKGRRGAWPNEYHCPAWGSGIGRELFPLAFEIFPQPGLFAGL
ncbi:hypothetical protein EPIB1_2238 [Tritonibacter mobilis]|nr:hypothetical protein EPIB1_2238 [Tritonibacter mobilis]